MRELLSRIDSDELTSWQLYAELEPFGEERADLRAGIIAAVIANANRDQKKRREPFTPRDFMPCLNAETRREPSNAERLRKLAAALGARPAALSDAGKRAGDHVHLAGKPVDVHEQGGDEQGGEDNGHEQQEALERHVGITSSRQSIPGMRRKAMP